MAVSKIGFDEIWLIRRFSLPFVEEMIMKDLVFSVG